MTNTEAALLGTFLGAFLGIIIVILQTGHAAKDIIERVSGAIEGPSKRVKDSADKVSNSADEMIRIARYLAEANERLVIARQEADQRSVVLENKIKVLETRQENYEELLDEYLRKS